MEARVEFAVQPRRNADLAVVQGRDFLRARSASKRKAAMPEGTPVIFAGGRNRFPTDDEAKTFASNVWATLDKVHGRVPDMVLIHGGDTKGVDRLAASWAERRGVAQLTFALDMRLGARAGFKRNEQMLSLDPRYVIAFPGNGVLERLVIDAKGAAASPLLTAAVRSAPALRRSIKPQSGNEPAHSRQRLRRWRIWREERRLLCVRTAVDGPQQVQQRRTLS